MATVLQKIKGKLIDKTSDVLSIVPRLKAKKVIRQANIDYHALKEDHKSGNNFIAPDSSNVAWQNRSLANDARYRRGYQMK